MSADLKRQTQAEEEGLHMLPKKKGIVTGIRDRSEVESMIQRYLELAQRALKEDKK